MDMRAFYLGRTASGRCAATFLNEALYLNAEIKALTAPDDIKARLADASGMLHGSYFDINTENEEMDQLFDEQNRARAIHVRLNRLVQWLNSDVMALGALNADLAIRKAEDPGLSLACSLMLSASTNVMASYIELFDAVKALPPFESLPVEPPSKPGSFPAVNTPYAPLSAANSALAAELQAIADQPHERSDKEWP